MFINDQTDIVQFWATIVLVITFICDMIRRWVDRKWKIQDEERKEKKEELKRIPRRRKRITQKRQPKSKSNENIEKSNNVCE